MANRFALPIFSTSKVDQDNSPKKGSSFKSANTTPRGKSICNSLNSSTPLSSRNESEKENFKTPINLNSSKQRWKSASAIENGKFKTPDKISGQHHACSPSLSPKSRTPLMRFCSENSLNDSHDTSIPLTPSSPRGENSNFVVGVRVRPFNAKEEKDKAVRNVVTMKDKEVSLTCGSGTVHMFSYDHCFWSFDENHPYYANQNTVFETMVEPLLDQLMLGYNACLLAYGQTGSGKSYSMMGIDGGNDNLCNDTGVIPRFCSTLFERASKTPHETCVEISYYEIYNEKIHDLLASHSNGQRPALRVREHPTLGPYVVDLAVHGVNSFNDVKGWLTVGNSHRVTAATAVNEKSSRSHSIFSIVVTQKREGVTTRSRANLVDLAGSERVAQTNATGHQLKEGVSINKSLLTLGKVITFLSERGKRRTTSSIGPYRESVLTWLLRESLGGNSKTAMLATISPANVHLDETLATLRYACQARSIVNRVHPNEDANERILRELKNELEMVATLRAELDQMKKLAEANNQDQESAKSEEIDQLKSQLREAEAIMAQYHKPWEEKLQSASKKKTAELQYLKGCGVAVESKMDPSQPCLVTLLPDPILSETLLYPLPPGRKTIGRATDADIVLHSPLVSQQHCDIENKDGRLWLRPTGNGETYVNGVAVTRDTELMHGDRVVVGGVHFFRVRTCMPTGDETDTCADFEQAQRELKREQEIRLKGELRAELDAAHAQELNNMLALLDAKTNALEAERRGKRALEEERNDLLAQVDGRSNAIGNFVPYRSSFLEELQAVFAQSHNCGNLSLLDTHLLVREATQRCTDLNMSLEFYQEQLEGDSGLEPVVRVMDTGLKLTAIWQPDQFLLFLGLIRENEEKQKIQNVLNKIDVVWEEMKETTRPIRRISVRRRKSQIQIPDGLSGTCAESLAMIRNHATRLEKADLPKNFELALNHLRAFLAALPSANSIEATNKTVRFAAEN